MNGEENIKKHRFWRGAQFDTISLCLIKVAGRVTEMVTRIKIALPTSYGVRVYGDCVGGAWSEKCPTRSS